MKRILIPFFTGILWWLFSFPARISGDSLYVLENIKDGRLSELHTVMYHIFVLITSMGGRFIWITTFIQVLLMCLAVVCTIENIMTERSPKTRTIVATIIIISPFGGGFATTVWASVMATIFTLFFFSLIFSIFNQQDKYWNFKAFLVGCLAVTFRPETFLVFLITCCGLFLVDLLLGKKSFRPQIKVISTAAISGFLLTTVLSFVSGADEAPKYYRISAQLHDLAYISEKNQEKILESYLPGVIEGDSLMGSKYCVNSVPFLFSEGFNYDEIKISDFSINKLWIKSVIKHPGDAFYLHACRSGAFLPPPLSLGPAYTYYLHSGIDSNTLGYKFNPILNLDSEISTYLSSFFDFLAKVILWPGMIFLLSLILVLTKSRENEKALLILFFSVSNIAVLFVFTVAQDFRYAQTLMLLNLVIITDLLLSIRKGMKKKTLSKSRSI